MFEALLARIRGEYREMPGLRLTAQQGSRLWALDRDECEELLRVLTDQGFLVCSADGKYGRPADCLPEVPHQMAKAVLKDHRTTISVTPAVRRAGER